MKQKRNPAVIVISSRVVRGAVGGRASQFALEAMGFAVWMVSTVELGWHPGHGQSTRIIPDGGSFRARLEELAQSQWIGEVAAVLTGYFADEEQVEVAADFVRDLKNTNADVFHLCDPVLGDDGGLYVDKTIAEAVRNSLLPIADITTPNTFELGYLGIADAPKQADECVVQAKALACDTVLVTSCPSNSADLIGNLLVTGDEAMVCEHATLNSPPKGSGDLLAAVFLGNRLRGLGESENLALSSASVLEVLQKTVARGGDELFLEQSLQSIRNPEVSIAVNELND